MWKKSLENFLRLRYVVPSMIVLTLAMALLGEMAYQRTVSALRYGIALTEARIGSARILQLLTDAETGQRGYLLTANPSYLDLMQKAEQELFSNKNVFDFIAGIGPTGTREAQQLNDLALQKFDELKQVIRLADGGDKASALAQVNSGEGKQRMDEMRVRFGAKFTEAAQLQAGARTVIYDTLLFNRVAVLLLSLLMAGGLYAYWRRLQTLEFKRQSRQHMLEDRKSVV